MSRPARDEGAEPRRVKSERLVADPSVAQRCHTDALHCIFAFLDLKDRANVLRSCRDWQLAVGKEPPRDLSVEIRSAALDGLCASPLRRHVAEVKLTHPAPRLRLAELRLLRSLPRLTSLDAALDGADLHAALAAGLSREQRAQPMRDALPPQLRRLSAVITPSPAACADAARQALLDALPALAQLTDLRLPEYHGELDFSPLLHLPLLRHLSLGARLSRHHCAVVKQLAALVSLDGGPRDFFLHDGQLTNLLTPPHGLQRLERIHLRDSSIDPPLLALLLQLPSLTALEPRAIRPECWAGLRGLTRLRTLRLHESGHFTANQLAALGESLSALPNLSDLDISLYQDRNVDGPPLALRLPALRRLHLDRVRVPSLGFLQHSPLVEKLHLSGCLEMSGADVMASLRAYPPSRLRVLQLVRCVDLSAEEQAQLQPPSNLLPALRTFRAVGQ